jgi:hypothetical protein
MKDDRDFSELIEKIHNGQRISLDDLSGFSLPVFSIALKLLNNGYHFTFDELLKMGEVGPEIAWWMSYYRHIFTMDELITLGDIHFEDGERTISINMATRGHKVFTFDEIQRLNNPADKFGATLAHWQARYEHLFSVDELLKLNNARISYFPGDEYYMDSCRYIWYSVADIDEGQAYRSSENLMHNGATVAHIMARQGHQFKDEEIGLLGDPKDAAGLSVSDWMKISRYQDAPRQEKNVVFTKKEISNPTIYQAIHGDQPPKSLFQKLFLESDIRLLTNYLVFIALAIPILFGGTYHYFPIVTEDFPLLGIITACLLIALSGFIQIIRKEYPGVRVGESLKGPWAAVLGGLVFIFFVVLALILIFIRLKFLFK